MRLLVILLIFISGCTTIRHTAGIEGTANYISDSIPEDPTQIALLESYQQIVSKDMNEVVASIATELEKHRPESTMGNWVTDALRNSLIRKGYTVDIAILNNGGMRLPSIGEGDLTVGRIYELWPFDDNAVIMHMSGAELLVFIKRIAEDGGWPISNGNRLVIHKKKFESFLHFEKEVDPDRIYHIAVSKYISQGGDQSDYLKTIDQTEIPFLVRDAFIDEARYLTSKGFKIHSLIESRIVIHQP